MRKPMRAPKRAPKKTSAKIIIRNKPIKPAPVDEDRETRLPVVEEAFSRLWENLFKSPVHLDSLLSKQTPRLKSILAQIVPSILLRPVSLAESLGIGVPGGHPWSLSPQELVGWRPGQLMAARSYTGMVGKRITAEPIMEDFPPWMTSEWKESWGARIQAELVDTLAREAPMSVRATIQGGRNKLLKGLMAGGRLPVKAAASDITPFGIRLSGYAPILQSEEFERGEFEIQDEGSQILSLFALWPEWVQSLLQKQPGRSSGLSPSQEFLKGLGPMGVPKTPPPAIVVDACAGAGGKTLAMADVMRGRGRVYAYDISQTKLQALRRRAIRGGYNNIQTVLLKEGAEQETIGSFANKANAVLVDAPCSGWGVLRRNPDIKWRQTPESRERFPVIQMRLLSLYSQLVAPGGRLTYGVCTFRPAETQEVVKRFSESDSRFKSLCGGYVGPGPSDGFFMHTWIREK